jgi:hypothetical protein
MESGIADRQEAGGIGAKSEYRDRNDEKKREQ